MAFLEDLQMRPAKPSDAEAVAALHADSWRRHYRGAYSDAFLDGDVISDRFVVCFSWVTQLHGCVPRARAGRARHESSVERREWGIRRPPGRA